MKNLHLLPTDKPPIKGDLLLRHIWEGKPNECISWWRYNDTSTYGSVVVYTTLNGSFMDSPSSFKVQNLYITSDEEIKEGDYFIESLGLPDSYLVHKLSKEWKDKESFYRRCTKVILTTDQDLIKDGVQAIDDEFLEWFVKNPSCEEVEVEIETTSIQLPQQQLSENSYDLAFRWINKKVYKIIIPKEPKQEKWDNLNKELDDALEEEFGSEEQKQETLEEVAEKHANLYYDKNSELSSVITESIEWSNRNHNFIEGAKWMQERMYSEEEVKHIVSEALESALVTVDLEQWFTQFKKK